MNLEELRLSREISSLAKIAFGSKLIVPVGNENVSFVNSTYCFGYVLPCFRTLQVLFQNKGSVGKDAIRFLVEKNAPYGLSSYLKIPHSVLDVCREMDELRSINMSLSVLLLRNRGRFRYGKLRQRYFDTGFLFCLKPHTLFQVCIRT